MRYIKIATLEYPLYEGDIRLEYPEITEDQTGDKFPCPDTYALVNVPDAPEYNEDTQTILESAPTQTNGVWSVTVSVRDLNVEELAIRASILEMREKSTPLKHKTNLAGNTPNVI